MAKQAMLSELVQKSGFLFQRVSSPVIRRFSAATQWRYSHPDLQKYDAVRVHETQKVFSRSRGSFWETFCAECGFTEHWKPETLQRHANQIWKEKISFQTIKNNQGILDIYIIENPSVFSHAKLKMHLCWVWLPRYCYVVARWSQVKKWHSEQ